MTNKTALREHAKTVRNSLSAERLLQASVDFCRLLAETEAYRKAPLLLVYASVHGELSTHRLVRLAWNEGKTVAYPRCKDKGQMDFVPVTDETQLVEGAYGIPEPQADLPPLTAIPPDTLCIVPGLVFDKKGHRLGYGGGYYDRFLASFPCVSVGGCVRELLADSLPIEATDIPVHTVFFV